MTSLYPDSRTVAPFGWLSTAAAWLAMACGAGVLAMWVVGGSMLSYVFPARVAMLPSTAAGVLLAGAAILLLREGASHRACAAGEALAGAVIVLGALALLDRLEQAPLHLGRLFFPGAVRAHVDPAGRMMSIHSAVSFAAIGAALLLTARETRRGWRAGQLAAAGVLMVAFLALLGHVYNVARLYTAGPFAGGMSLPTSVAFLFLSTAVFFLRPARGFAALMTGDDASGLLARQLLFPTLVLPVVFGWMFLHARRTEALSRETAVAFFAIAVVGTFAALVLRAAAAVRDVDREREASLVRERRARSEAEEANRAKMDFLAVMSHELRTPLNAIAGYTQLLEMGIHGEVSEPQREALAKIRRSQKHLLLLINDVLNFAKLEAGRLEVRPAPVQVAELVAGVEPLILPQAEARGLRFVARLPDAPVTVRADPEKAGQVLLNLLSNAVKFTEPGGEVRVECEPNGTRVMIRVADTGVGIPPERLE
ncbi:MAG TPA: histidine kinase dimerization/phospho-acceptor domain-containing protein, partial [Longimicrobium sp.]|nr:histidine kinase dimerization/phospho-acceptor domain-containing protein [Longimicrobium sp.]